MNSYTMYNIIMEQLNKIEKDITAGEPPIFCLGMLKATQNIAVIANNKININDYERLLHKIDEIIYFLKVRL